MAYAVNDAVNQVFSLLGEAANTPLAELPTGTGPADSPTITSSAQVVIFLTQAARELVKAGVLSLYSGGTYSVPIAAKKALYTSFTMDTSGYVFYRPQAATWNSVGVQMASRRWYEVHNPTIDADSTGTPVRVYVDIDGVLLAPRPSASQVLRLQGLVLPRDQVAGSNVYDVPDHLVPAMIYWAAAEAAAKHAGRSERLHALESELRGKWLAAIGRSE